MKKYILLIAISIISLASVNLAYAGPEDDACSSKRNGDACSYTIEGRGARSDRTTSGFCDRTNNNPDPTQNPLTCKAGTNANSEQWFDCAVSGDVCIDKATNTRGRCESSTSGTSVRNQETTWTCNTSGTPGGTSGTGGDSPLPGGTGGTSGATDASSPQTVGFINPSRFNSITALIAGIINALLGILGAITVAVLVSSGFKYMTSSNPGEVGQALDGIKNAVIGLIIIMGAFLITQYVITALAV
jgi:hypothetical protein